MRNNSPNRFNEDRLALTLSPTPPMSLRQSPPSHSTLFPTNMIVGPSQRASQILSNEVANNGEGLALTLPPPPPISTSSMLLPPTIGLPIDMRVPLPSLRAPRRNCDEIDEIYPPPYPWATTRLASIQSLNSLLRNGISNIKGNLKCQRCDNIWTKEFDLQSKYEEVCSFVRSRTMHDRAPREWMHPKLLDCPMCKRSASSKPEVCEDERLINWLFLFLGQMLGFCTLKQLRYFCKHNEIHRTGVKDRVLYSTYIKLCTQLRGNSGPSDH